MAPAADANWISAVRFVKMTYREFQQKEEFNQEELLAYANGTLLDDGPATLGLLPTPPMLMFDRIGEIRHSPSGGFLAAEQNVRVDAWYFWCHFRNDPVQPGCLGVDAVWQMIGFFLMLRGVQGAGRALGCQNVEFAGQIRPHNKLVRYEVDILRVTQMREAGAAIAIGNGCVRVDGELIYTIQGARVGAFTGIRYADYPRRSANSIGGASTGLRPGRGERSDC